MPSAFCKNNKANPHQSYDIGEGLSFTETAGDLRNPFLPTYLLTIKGNASVLSKYTVMNILQVKMFYTLPVFSEDNYRLEVSGVSLRDDVQGSIEDSPFPRIRLTLDENIYNLSNSGRTIQEGSNLVTFRARAEMKDWLKKNGRLKVPIVVELRMQD